jgi:hypothetical protein
VIDPVTAGAGPHSASADPPPSRVHTPTTGSLDDGNCVEFWLPHIRGLIKKLSPKWRKEVPDGWETWTGVGELERLANRLLDYIADEEGE